MRGLYRHAARRPDQVGALLIGDDDQDIGPRHVIAVVGLGVAMAMAVAVAIAIAIVTMP